KNPRTNRPVKTLEATHNRSLTWNAATRLWEVRNHPRARGSKKDTPFIKKTSLTIPPPDGKMTYYGGNALKYRLGIGFMASSVKVKPHYVFGYNIASDKRPWIFDTSKPN